MPKTHKPRAGSLQFWPRKRASKILPSANWKALQKKHSEKTLLGFIGYKVGMIRVLAKDLTPNSLTKNKKIIIPSTLIACPPMRVLAFRFYKDGKVAFDILSENLDKELKRKIKFPKEKTKVRVSEKFDDIEKKLKEFSDIHLITYSVVKQTGIKKKPDIIEIGISGSISEKFEFAKKYINQEIKIEDFLNPGQLVDIRGLTKGYGSTGPVKRFGISLRQHKSEKGQRRAGSIGPWTPSRITFRAPMAGQHGFFTRISYNSKILDVGSTKEKKIPFEFPHYGKIKTSYILAMGSVQGPPKRQLLLTLSLRETKREIKKNFEILNLLR